MRILSRHRTRYPGDANANGLQTSPLAAALREAGAEVDLLAPEEDEIQAFNHLDKGETELLLALGGMMFCVGGAAIDSRRRGGPDDLLVLRDDEGPWRDVRSEDVNAYLREKAGETFSAKDFRTWHGTVSPRSSWRARGRQPRRPALSARSAGHQAGRRAPRQYPRGLRQLLHRPPRPRPLPRRQDDRDSQPRRRVRHSSQAEAD
jgi:hypothetical protein